MFKDFKAFVTRGNVLDLAVAFIIGAAFSAIVKSLVSDIIMPPIGLLLGDVDFENLFILLKEGTTAGPYATAAAAREAGAVIMAYGTFINLVIKFLIVAFVMFLAVRTAQRMKRKEVAEAPADPTTKPCPFCVSTIAITATRCPFCTSDLVAGIV